MLTTTGSKHKNTVQFAQMKLQDTKTNVGFENEPSGNNFSPEENNNSSGQVKDQNPF